MEMTVSQLLILMVVGLLAGLLGGTLGVGGAIIVVPALVLIFGFTQHQAQGTSLAFMIPPVTLLAVINYWKEGHVNWKVALVLSIMFFIGAYLGSYISFSISEKILKKIFGIFIIIVALKMIFSK
ncbi:MAG: sulfite exporter TauE/SafE family protein [Prolixibacteraceae bacterium]|nr:sulfite exporter TauE/SafE family protein [Prolixibacteraceae bacterium]